MTRTKQSAASPARAAHAYRTAFLGGITPADVQMIGTALLERPKAGDVQAARLLLDRILGSASVADWPNAAALELVEMVGAD